MSLFGQLTQFFRGGDIQQQEPRHPHLARAVLLLEAAIYDSDFAEQERSMIEHLLERKYGLSAIETHDLLVLAGKDRERLPDVYAYTREIRRELDRDSRKELMTELWQVIFADGVLEEDEELFARKMQKLLGLDHSEWIEAKLTARDLS